MTKVTGIQLLAMKMNCQISFPEKQESLIFSMMNPGGSHK